MASSSHRCQWLYKHSHQLAALTDKDRHLSPGEGKTALPRFKSLARQPWFYCSLIVVFGARLSWVPASFSIWKSTPSTSWSYCKGSESASEWSKFVTCQPIYTVTHRHSIQGRLPPDPASSLTWCFTCSQLKYTHANNVRGTFPLML